MEISDIQDFWYETPTVSWSTGWEPLNKLLCVTGLPYIFPLKAKEDCPDVTNDHGFNNF